MKVNMEATEVSGLIKSMCGGRQRVHEQIRARTRRKTSFQLWLFVEQRLQL